MNAMNQKDLKAGTDEKEARVPKSEGCCWARCACAGHKPYHTMRICKGCRVYVYCGPKCQKRCVACIPSRFLGHTLTAKHD